MDFDNATNGAVTFGGTVGVMKAAGETCATWNDSNAPNAWAAPSAVLTPTQVPLGVASTSFNKPQLYCQCNGWQASCPRLPQRYFRLRHPGSSSGLQRSYRQPGRHHYFGRAKHIEYQHGDEYAGESVRHSASRRHDQGLRAVLLHGLCSSHHQLNANS